MRENPKDNENRRKWKKEKKPSRVTVSDVALALAILNLLFILFCECILK